MTADGVRRDPAHSRLRWQCRRGMRELDELLLRYLDRRYASAGAAEMLAFRKLLALPDPELVNYLLKREQPEEEAVALVVAHILEHSPA